MLEQRIQQQFFESADLHYQSADLLARPVAEAVQALVATLTAGGRVLIAGLGASAALAQLAASALLGRFERERPGLPVLALGADGVALMAGGGAGPDAMLARQIETLGQPGDLLLLIDGEDGALNDAPAICGAAQGKDMTVVALVGRSLAVLRDVLGETDVLVTVPHERRARVLETQLLVLHCLCDAVDLQLLGEQDPS